MSGNLFAVHVEGELTLVELRDIFARAGYFLQIDGSGRMVARRVPPFLRRDPAQQQDTNVVKLARRRPGIAR